MKARKAKLSRKTRETEVSVSMNLDGTGECKIGIEDQFLRHMVETLARYSSFDIDLKAVGDNKHHVVEDAGIVLGTALRQALASDPIERVASATVPMDDALVTAAVDMIDRPYVDVECPDDLCMHFFRSLAMSAGITLHIRIDRGFDEHHITEAGFKALGIALREAVVRRERFLSTKERPKVRRG